MHQWLRPSVENPLGEGEVVVSARTRYMPVVVAPGQGAGEAELGSNGGYSSTRPTAMYTQPLPDPRRPCPPDLDWLRETAPPGSMDMAA